ncbi:MAG: hypothetical protein NUV75_01790 [Gallionella sp.]|nr:hypothetical protein [Gallionella sp.]
MTAIRTGYLRQYRHQQPHDSLWREYEARKQEYLARHPDAPQTAYEAEMKRIRDELGVA